MQNEGWVCRVSCHGGWLWALHGPEVGEGRLCPSVWYDSMMMTAMVMTLMTMRLMMVMMRRMAMVTVKVMTMKKTMTEEVMLL